MADRSAGSSFDHPAMQRAPVYSSPRPTAIDSAPGRVALAMHHPPFKTGITWMDESGFEGLELFEATIREHPVERIVCGHIHR